MQIHRRAAEVKNQPGPHAEKALAAFRRAFDRPWADGERLLMAQLLRDFGAITPEALGAEQLRQLARWSRPPRRRPLERLHVAECHAAALRDRGKPVEGIAALAPPLADYIAATKGVFTQEALAAAQLLAALHETRADYAGAERLWLGWRSAAANDQLRVSVTQQLDQTYVSALQHDGEVTLGKGETLYAALLGRLNERLRNPESNERHQTLNALQNLFNVAESKKFARLKADVLVLATETFPRLVKPWDSSYTSHVQTVGVVVRQHAGPAAAVEFLVGRVEALPAWLRRGNPRGWGQYAGSLALWRHEAPALPAALDARLLKLAVAELTEDLRSRRQLHREMYDRRYQHYWAAKEPEFARRRGGGRGRGEGLPRDAVVRRRLPVPRRPPHRPGHRRAVRPAPREAAEPGGPLHAGRLPGQRQPARGGRRRGGAPDGRDARRRDPAVPADEGVLPPRQAGRAARPLQPQRGPLEGAGPAGPSARCPGFADAAQNCGLHKEAADVYAELIPNVQRDYPPPSGTLSSYYRRLRPVALGAGQARRGGGRRGRGRRPPGAGT